MRVLIVDDNSSARSILCYLFRAHNWEIEEAVNGREGLHRARASRFDLIISDAMMPVMDGFQFLREVNLDATLRNIPFIFHSAIYTGRDDEALARSQGAAAFIAKPTEPEAFWTQIETVLQRRVVAPAAATEPKLPDEETYLRDYSHVVVAKLEEKVTELEDLFITLIRVLVNLLEAKSPWTKGHSQRVADYAVQIARQMKLDENRVSDIRIAGLLHDIGKIGTYDKLLNKLSHLSTEEYAIVQRHPDQGADMLEGIKQLHDILPSIRYHHEHLDGSGYPRGLDHEQIPLAARILTVADAFDSITSDRPYRKAASLNDALQELKAMSGSHFDSGVVESVLELAHQGRLEILSACTEDTPHKQSKG